MKSIGRGGRLAAAAAIAWMAAAGVRAETIVERCDRLLDQALENKNPDTRRQAAVALSLAGPADGPYAKLEGMLDDRDVPVRIAVVASLMEVKSDDAKAALHKALKDEVPEVSFAAAKGLWAMQDPAGKEALLAVLSKESKASSGYISKQKRDAARMLHTPRVLALFAFREGMGFVPVPGLGQGVNSMQALLTDPGVTGRATAALLLGSDPSPETLAALKDALLDMEWSVRAAAVHSLALRKDPAIEGKLEPMLNDDKEPVRLRAAAGILRLKGIEEKQIVVKPAGK